MLTVTNLRKTFVGHDSQTVNAIDDVSFEIENGQIFTLLGPSGCGKTTTLRSIAGLERPDSGEIRIGDEIVFSPEKRILKPVHARQIGMVFQSYAIWPHMTVFNNVAFPLKVSRTRYKRKEVERMVMEALSLVRLEALAGRDATKLSGGQQQRLSLARALVRRPQLLLLDEPLSNLDAQLREQMRFEVKRLQREVGVSCLYVTHDQLEALALSDRIAIIRDGRIQQVGAPQAIYESPANEFVAAFIGSTNIISANALEPNGTGARSADTPLGRLVCGAGSLDIPSGQAIVAIRQERICVDPSDPDGRNSCEAVVSETVYTGENQELVLDCGGTILRARTPVGAAREVGSRVRIELPTEHCVLLPSTDPSANQGGTMPGK